MKYDHGTVDGTSIGRCINGGTLDRLKDTYIARATRAIERSLRDARLQLEGADPDSRAAQLPQYIEILQSCRSGRAITKDEYEHGTWNSPTDKFVICSSVEAKDLLASASPRLPIFVPAELNLDFERRLSLDQYLDFLETQANVDVHVFDDRIPRGAVIRPRRMAPGRARELLHDGTRGPVNLLSLKGHKKNPDPSCFLDLPGYTVLEDIQGHPDSIRPSTDLRMNITFQLCGKKGAFSMPHIDHHGFITAVFNDEGEKLWPLWPGIGLHELRLWAESGHLPPSPSVGIYLYPGCLLIQPSGMLHAPYSITTVLMSGVNYWCSRDMLHVMLLSRLEAEHPHMTNEDMAQEFLPKVSRIRDLWKSNSPAWPWGGANELAQFSGLVEWFLPPRRKGLCLPVPSGKEVQEALARLHFRGRIGTGVKYWLGEWKRSGGVFRRRELAFWDLAMRMRDATMRV
ncbi:hypothetical protein NKR23_g2115 [Pleurostoma richardsiae]|uniref:JmjC domain-containing protein n=1 Tax=Pleurostoma richardsiae TaxID=41990 RepID=A0AA38VYX6_9PEZI|nr:hypothetical protein NKR23_g2115 [Pleurostoma richardsiae]